MTACPTIRLTDIQLYRQRREVGNRDHVLCGHQWERLTTAVYLHVCGSTDAGRGRAQRSAVFQGFIVEDNGSSAEILQLATSWGVKQPLSVGDFRYAEQKKKVSCPIHKLVTQLDQQSQSLCDSICLDREILDQRVPEQMHSNAEGDAERDVGGDDEDDSNQRTKHRYQQSLVQDWMDSIEPTSENEMALYLSYERFFKTSNAYCWLVQTLQSSWVLDRDHSHAMDGLNIDVQNIFNLASSSRKMSRSKPASAVELTITLHEWDISTCLKTFGTSDPQVEDLDTLLCVTGSANVAQMTTMAEYLSQTWPGTCEPVLVLLKELLSGSDHTDRRYCCMSTSTSTF